MMKHRINSMTPWLLLLYPLLVLALVLLNRQLDDWLAVTMHALAGLLIRLLACILTGMATCFVFTLKIPSNRFWSVVVLVFWMLAPNLVILLVMLFHINVSALNDYLGQAVYFHELIAGGYLLKLMRCKKKRQSL